MGGLGTRSGTVLLGGGGHARSVAEVLRELSQPAVGYVDSRENEHTRLAWLGKTPASLATRVDQVIEFSVFPAVGDNLVRQRTWGEALDCGFRPCSPLVSRFAHVAEDVQIGAGAIVMPGAIIRTGTTVGAGAIVNTGAIVDHDCRLGDFVHVGPGTVCTGGAHVDDVAFVGAGARILPGLRVGSRAIVGAGAVVCNDVEPDAVVVGIPARRLR